MTGERILYIVLIAVAIGIGIYGSMNSLFRPHVYYSCEGKTFDASFYINERENYLVYIPVYVDSSIMWKFDRKVETNDTTTKYSKDTGYVEHNRIGNHFFVFPTGGTYGNCMVTRQFLQRN